ncbi:MAG: hypothetical protein JXB38_04000 [Anaerolineales bacterium]|nr:hypothetical protein [Anaerolineales bacterium]
MNDAKNTISKNRLGIHYFPDTVHYREQDLQAWLPELQALGVTWITLVAPVDRAIPEAFIRGLVAAGIRPILHFPLKVESAPPPEELVLLFEAYQRWGVGHIALFDRPNSRTSWPGASWAQTNLIERFLDAYLPYAKLIVAAGMTPVFPPLEPGGDYWDTAFLRSTLQTLEDRKEFDLLKSLVIGAYAWADNLSLNWGAGGPERWPGTRPYFTPPDEQDQTGFRIFDWYTTISRAVLGEPLPVIILAGGSRIGDQRDITQAAINPDSHAARTMAVAQLLAGEYTAEDERIEPIPDEVLACNFWFLAANPEHTNAKQAWYQADGTTLPIVSRLKEWQAVRPSQPPTETQDKAFAPESGIPKAKSSALIDHYLLLPTYEWGVADWHLEVIQPFVKKYCPTIGFSVEEAANAARVTVVGGEQSFPEDVIRILEQAGCQIEQISGDGTSIATKLASA